MKHIFLIALVVAGACVRADREAPSADTTSATRIDTTAAAPNPQQAPPVAESTGTASKPSEPAPPVKTSSNWAVTAEGIGPIKAGMTLDQANAAVGKTLDVPSALQECDYTRTRNAPAGVNFMIQNRRIVRVDIRNNKEVKTAEGAGIGDTEEKVKSLYPGQVTVRPAKYDNGHTLVVTPRNGPADNRIVFETDGKTVTQFRSGKLPAVEYVEGCG